MSLRTTKIAAWLSSITRRATERPSSIVGGMAVLPDKVNEQGIPLPILWLIGKWKFGAYLPTLRGRM